ncbi:hypothetical protein TREMEDRAFT_57311 [Tremella mesenterica DSM 1558]|uniref:uncharacterized protein n=1 Tax=Tremella mesenterica (strain ATCC 24925 / CBS 8224 / DSM 1558 / NBRC 9311 / NRRL Y-6157 / RJB 2259-6 / UBC 559-6) TaxID=578456 RepID=UPI0003F4A455|nr:uncharacterized protein TREMEDRAFT_57311 [Tremella mesenterica DSM 1558]EIW68394.1 hypothetical protein TREMEDRAFT_57311 [Tremella mesenterica DSM 1558]
MSIPKVQTAAIVPELGGDLTIKTDHPVPTIDSLKPGECLVKISHTGVCHTDLHAKMGDWPVKPMVPLIGGHEGVGEIVGIAPGTANSPVKVGDRVGIKWMADSCLDCEFCRKGLEMTCPKVKYSGYTVDGTFSQYVVSFVHHVTPIPEGIDSAEAASLLCAGVTVYKALKQSNTIVGNYVAIPGAGGGLGHLAVQYAVAMGLRVIAIDTGKDKKDLSLSLGAETFIDFKEEKDIVGAIKSSSEGLGPHAAIVASASAGAYKQAIDYLRPGGTLVCVGMPDADIGINAFWCVFKAIRVQGSYVGNRQDAVEALEMGAAGKVKVHYQLRELEDLKQTYEDLEAGKIAGRIVLKVS